MKFNKTATFLTNAVSNFDERLPPVEMAVSAKLRSQHMNGNDIVRMVIPEKIVAVEFTTGDDVAVKAPFFMAIPGHTPTVHSMTTTCSGFIQ